MKVNFLFLHKRILYTIILFGGFEPTFSQCIPVSITEIVETVCEGDSVEINGIYYTEGSYTDTLYGAASNGCDSILWITIIAIPMVTDTISYWGCEGDGYTIIVNGTNYDESNPTGLEMLETQQGCDSLIVIQLTFHPSTHTLLVYEGCTEDGFIITEHGIVCDPSNPVIIGTLTGNNGCDSIITIHCLFHDISYGSELYTGCLGDGYSVLVNNSLYDESHPTGVDTLIASTGCDSIVTINLQFLDCMDSLFLLDDQVCVSGTADLYQWYTCSGAPLQEFGQCISVIDSGCVCVIVTQGLDADTICETFFISTVSDPVMHFSTSLSFDNTSHTLLFRYNGILRDKMIFRITDIEGRRLSIQKVEAHEDGIWQIQLHQLLPSFLFVTALSGQLYSTHSIFIPAD